ncbi:hypothetical protein CAP31_03800 [Sulfuriferula sp. AH1]|uniref:hypothetical protein n=1 Tax=Sulfuriferula sp. AH1 TaxID=1985873 RepID=UPI000B3B8521|nr:hypothetical protein [Sulfuriferula sp. AH1]ARU30886.1 hypothetical protein CAP31_03800 [Sulfuriferula sp. AH1]
MAADEHTLLLGEIKGKLDLVIARQVEQGETLDVLDGRMRAVEVKSAMHGGLAGGLVAIGMTLLVEKAKRVVGMA